MHNTTYFRILAIGGISPYLILVIGGLDPIISLGILVIPLPLVLFATLFFVPIPPDQDPASPMQQSLVAELRRWPWTVSHAIRRSCAIGGLLAPLGMALALALQGTGWFGFLFALSLVPVPLSILWHFGWLYTLVAKSDTSAQSLP